jgi:hypothetical protein
VTFEEFRDDFLKKQGVGFTFGVEASQRPLEQFTALARVFWDAGYASGYGKCSGDQLVADPRNSQEPR